jgi:hypothetical protein
VRRTRTHKIKSTDGRDRRGNSEIESDHVKKHEKRRACEGAPRKRRRGWTERRREHGPMSQTERRTTRKKSHTNEFGSEAIKKHEDGRDKEHEKVDEAEKGSLGNIIQRSEKDEREGEMRTGRPRDNKDSGEGRERDGNKPACRASRSRSANRNPREEEHPERRRESRKARSGDGGTGTDRTSSKSADVETQRSASRWSVREGQTTEGLGQW